MFVQCSTVKRKGKDGRNRKLVEAYRDPNTGQPRNRTVQKLEKLPILERSRLILKHNGHRHLDADEWKALVEAGDFTPAEQPSYVGDSFRGAGNWVLLQYFKKTGLEDQLRRCLGQKTGAVIRDMITLQLLDTDSKLSYAKKRTMTLNYLLDGKPGYGEDVFYRALDKLEEQFESLREALNTICPPSGRLLLYDLSNSYFCGSKAELGGYGDSKEKRHDRYIVSYGLVTSEDDIPLDIKVWKGGTADAKTVGQTFVRWKQKYHTQQAIWVADRSMSGEPNLSEVQQLGLSYITGLPSASQQALLGQLHEESPELFDQQLTEFTENDQRYILCRHAQKGYRREAQNHSNLRKAYEALKAIQASPQNSNKEKLYHRAMRVLEKHNQTKCWQLSFDSFKDKKDKDRYRLVFILDRHRFRAKNVIGHYYLLKTDLSEKQLTAQTATHCYKKLIKAGRCFRTLKSDLEIRPIRHRKANRIKGYIYLNFLALWLVKQIEKTWRSKQIHCQVPAKLKEWDDRIRIHEIYDKQSNKFLHLQWNRGPMATAAFEEVCSYGEMNRKLPHL
jgi:hypothetical protein